MGRNQMPKERPMMRQRWHPRRSGESSRLREHHRVATRIMELEAEKEARRRMQALSREDWVLKELEEIAFDDRPI